MTMIARAALAGAALLASSVCASAERVIISLSTHRVMITSNFTGTELVLFGSVERDNAPARVSGYDVVLTVKGPAQDIVTRRKARVLGIWANVESRVFADAPSYLGVFASRQLEAVANGDQRLRFQVGLENIPLVMRINNSVITAASGDRFRDAFIRLRGEAGLYFEDAKAVTFITPSLFRASIPMPAESQLGNYDVDVKVFADGELVARANSAMEIIKVGFEQYVANAAVRHGLLYGLATTMLALLTGWLASVIFRRD